MFWYASQTVVILWIIHIYATKLTPNEPMFDIVIFAILVSYLLTWVLSFLIDLLRLILTLPRRALLGLNALIGQQSRNHLGVHVTKKTLPRR